MGNHPVLEDRHSSVYSWRCGARDCVFATNVHPGTIAFSLLSASVRVLCYNGDMKPIMLDSYELRDFRTDGCIYVDKTAGLLKLIRTPGAKLYFISRPRRFGKSLMLSTLRHIFQGDRDLFEGTAIGASDYDWQTYPVLSFNFATTEVSSLKEFRVELEKRVQASLERMGIAYDPTGLPGNNFDAAIRELKARTGKPVVVLIDEYDSPVGHAMHDLELANAIRQRLASFYGVIKNNVGDIRFMMMTGVTKFTQLSIFSALNNLIDLTFDKEMSTLLGYTEEELETYFGEHMRAHAEVMGLEYDTYRAELRRWYNGYRFSPDSETTVYNPVSIGKTLAAKRRLFGATWAQTGHASALMNALKREPLLKRDYEHIFPLNEKTFDVYDLSTVEQTALLYQAGYLTIKDYSMTARAYTLGVPNEEVRQDLNGLLVNMAAPTADASLCDSLRVALLTDDFENITRHLKAFFAGLTYGPREGQIYEANFQRILHTLLSAAGFYVTPEAQYASGRADLVATFGSFTFIFELKVDGTAQEALEQIEAKRYAAPYLRPGKKVTAIGLAFDSKTHQIIDAAYSRLAD